MVLLFVINIVICTYRYLINFYIIITYSCSINEKTKEHIDIGWFSVEFAPLYNYFSVRQLDTCNETITSYIYLHIYVRITILNLFWKGVIPTFIDSYKVFLLNAVM